MVRYVARLVVVEPGTAILAWEPLNRTSDLGRPHLEQRDVHIIEFFDNRGMRSVSFFRAD